MRVMIPARQLENLAIREQLLLFERFNNILALDMRIEESDYDKNKLVRA